MEKTWLNLKQNVQKELERKLQKIFAIQVLVGHMWMRSDIQQEGAMVTCPKSGKNQPQMLIRFNQMSFEDNRNKWRTWELDPYKHNMMVWGEYF